MKVLIVLSLFALTASAQVRRLDSLACPATVTYPASITCTIGATITGTLDGVNTQLSATGPISVPTRMPVIPPATTATFTAQSMPVAVSTVAIITASYVGVTKTASVTVLPKPSTPPPPAPDFTLIAQPPVQSIVAGGSTTYTVTVGPVNGFTGVVALSSNLGGTFSPTSITGAGTSTLTISSTTAGSLALTITGMSGGKLHSVPLTLNVSAPPPPVPGPARVIDWRTCSGTFAPIPPSTKPDDCGANGGVTFLHLIRPDGTDGGIYFAFPATSPPVANDPHWTAQPVN